MKPTGFTLIETMMYVALIAILYVALFDMVHLSFTAQSAVFDVARRESDADFVFQKIGWLVRHGTFVPQQDTSSSQLHYTLREEGIVRNIVIGEDEGSIIFITDGTKSILSAPEVGLSNFVVNQQVQGVPKRFSVSFDGRGMTMKKTYYIY